MPISRKLLEVLCCPVSHMPVHLADKALIEQLNTEIQSKRLETTAGEKLTQALSEGLVTSDNKTFYRIEDDIPVMLADQAISLLQLPNYP